MIEAAEARDSRPVRRRRIRAELELLHHPELSIVCFRYRGSRTGARRAGDDERLDVINTKIQERIEASGLGWLSLPHYRRRTILRAVILHPRCTEALLDQILDVVRSAGRELAATL